MSARTPRSQGQALAEMLIVLLGLVPLWLALLTYAGLQDVAATTQAAARYAAFDQAMAPEGVGTLATRVRRHVFDKAPGPVSSTSPPAQWAAYPGLWVDPTTRVRWLAAPAQVSVSVQASSLGGLAGTASAASLALVAPARPLAPGRFDPRARGPAASLVRAQLSGVSLPLLPQPLALSARASVLGDSWGAEGSNQVATRVAGLSPLRVLSPVTALVRPLVPLLALFEPRIRDFCPAIVNPDVLPMDRLAPPALIRQFPRC